MTNLRTEVQEFQGSHKYIRQPATVAKKEEKKNEGKK
jgi:hypothetical protein